MLDSFRGQGRLPGVAAHLAAAMRGPERLTGRRFAFGGIGTH